MFLGGSFLGATFLTNGVIIFESNSFNKITLYGEGKFDKAWIRNIEDSSYYDSIVDVQDYQPQFDADTVFLAEFNDNLSAGNISSGGDPIVSWIVSKRSSEGVINRLVGEFAANISSIFDFRVQKGESYTYQVTPKTSTTLGQPLLSESVDSEYKDIFLIDEDTGLVLNFGLNGTLDSMRAEDDVTIHKTFNKFDTIAQGDRNFLTGKVSGVVPESLDYGQDGIVQGTDFVDLVQDFVNNKSSKLLKTKKGDILKIRTKGFSRTQFVGKSKEQLDVISFDWVQIEDVIEYR